MVHKVDFTDTAKECLLRIADYIAEDNVIRAKSFVKEMRDSIYNTLSIFPTGSPLYQDIETEVEIRRYAYKDYNCYYYFSEKTQTVNILFIYNSAKEVKELLIEFINENKLI